MLTYIYKKAWEFSPSLVPHLEAFALPDTVERATRKPTPDMNVASIRRRTSVHRQKGRAHNTSRRASTVAMFLTVSESCEVSKCQAQSAVNAFVIYVSFPPVHLRGFRKEDNAAKIASFLIISKRFT